MKGFQITAQDGQRIRFGYYLNGIPDPFLNINTNGEVVYKNYQGTYEEAHRIPLATHTNMAEVWGFSDYQAAVLAFIRH